MTNRDMVKPGPASAAAGQGQNKEQDKGQSPNRAPLPPMPADEGSRTPTTDEEPVDSPQPNASAERGPPAPGAFGLTTKR